jgi:hypothetical protein
VQVVKATQNTTFPFSSAVYDPFTDAYSPKIYVAIKQCFMFGGVSRRRRKTYKKRDASSDRRTGISNCYCLPVQVLSYVDRKLYGEQLNFQPLKYAEQLIRSGC